MEEVSTNRSSLPLSCSFPFPVSDNCELCSHFSRFNVRAGNNDHTTLEVCQHTFHQGCIYTYVGERLSHNYHVDSQFLKFFDSKSIFEYLSVSEKRKTAGHVALRNVVITCPMPNCKSSMFYILRELKSLKDENPSLFQQKINNAMKCAVQDKVYDAISFWQEQGANLDESDVEANEALEELLTYYVGRGAVEQAVLAVDRFKAKVTSDIQTDIDKGLEHCIENKKYNKIKHWLHLGAVVNASAKTELTRAYNDALLREDTYLACELYDTGMVLQSDSSDDQLTNLLEKEVSSYGRVEILVSLSKHRAGMCRDKLSAEGKLKLDECLSKALSKANYQDVKQWQLLGAQLPLDNTFLITRIQDEMLFNATRQNWSELEAPLSVGIEMTMDVKNILDTAINHHIQKSNWTSVSNLLKLGVTFTETQKDKIRALLPNLALDGHNLVILQIMELGFELDSVTSDILKNNLSDAKRTNNAPVLSELKKLGIKLEDTEQGIGQLSNDPQISPADNQPQDDKVEVAAANDLEKSLQIEQLTKDVKNKDIEAIKKTVNTGIKFETFYVEHMKKIVNKWARRECDFMAELEWEALLNQLVA